MPPVAQNSRNSGAPLSPEEEAYFAQYAPAPDAAPYQDYTQSAGSDAYGFSAGAPDPAQTPAPPPPASMSAPAPAPYTSDAMSDPNYGAPAPAPPPASTSEATYDPNYGAPAPVAPAPNPATQDKYGGSYQTQMQGYTDAQNTAAAPLAPTGATSFGSGAGAPPAPSPYVPPASQGYAAQQHAPVPPPRSTYPKAPLNTLDSTYTFRHNQPIAGNPGQGSLLAQFYDDAASHARAMKSAPPKPKGPTQEDLKRMAKMAAMPPQQGSMPIGMGAMGSALLPPVAPPGVGGIPRPGAYLGAPPDTSAQQAWDAITQGHYSQVHGGPMPQPLPRHPLPPLAIPLPPRGTNDIAAYDATRRYSQVHGQPLDPATVQAFRDDAATAAPIGAPPPTNPPGFNPVDQFFNRVGGAVAQQIQGPGYDNPEVASFQQRRGGWSRPQPGSVARDWWDFHTSDAGREQNTQNVEHELTQAKNNLPSVSAPVGPGIGLTQNEIDRAALAPWTPTATMRPPQGVGTWTPTSTMRPPVQAGPLGQSSQTTTPPADTSFYPASSISGPRDTSFASRYGYGADAARQSGIVDEHGHFTDAGWSQLLSIPGLIDPTTGAWQQSAVDAGIVPPEGLGQVGALWMKPPPKAGAKPNTTTAATQVDPGKILPVTPAEVMAVESGGNTSGGNSKGYYDANGKWVWYNDYSKSSGGGGSSSGHSYSSGGSSSGHSYSSGRSYGGGGGYSGGSSHSYGSGHSGGGGFDFGNADTGGGSWQDFLKDFDHNGKIDSKDQAKAKAMFAASKKTRRGKRGGVGRGASNLPTVTPSANRTAILSKLSENLGRQVGGWPEGM